MDYYCNVFDESIKSKSKSELFQSLTHSKVEKCIQMKHTIKNPEYFNIDEFVNDFITNGKNVLSPLKMSFI